MKEIKITVDGKSELVQISPKQVETDPWATAIKGEELVGELKYPDLSGMEVMILSPDDHYNKKLLALGPLYVANAMQRCGIKVSVLDNAIYHYDDIEIVEILVKSKIKIFAMGALYPMGKEVERLCSLIRSVVPNATIILGGSLPSPIPEFIVRKMDADIAAIGEAEMTIPHLMSVLAGKGKLEDVKGIAYMKDGKFFDNGQPTLPPSANKKEVGWPAYDLWPVEKYITSPKFYPFKQSDRILPIVSGRGCPYACDFCFRVSAFRIRPFDDMLDEMEYLQKKYNLDGFYIVDDLLMVNKQKITEFCTGIIERGLKIKYNCTGRVNTVTPEIVKLLKDSGCIAVFYGIESGNQELLQTMSKKTTLAQVYNAVRLTREADIYCEYALMFGQPGENRKTIKDSVELIKKISYGTYRSNKIFGCVPFPGTGLYDWSKQKGLIKDDASFYDIFLNQHWSLDQIPVNMTELKDSEVNNVFHEANEELQEFFIEKMSDDWVRSFGGDIETIQRTKNKGKSMEHTRWRTEANANTFDTSGRT